MKLRFHSIENATDFVKKVSMLHFDVNLYDGSIIIDAKSIVGVLNLDFNKTFVVKCADSVPDHVYQLRSAVKEFEVE